MKARLDDDWSLWGSVCLRGTGFPISRVLALGDPALLDAADRVTAAEEAVASARAAALEVLRGDFASAPPETRVRVRRARKRVEKTKLPDPADVAGVAEDAVAALSAALEHLARERAAAVDVFAVARTRVSDAIRAVAGDAPFREAVTWQNRGAVANGLDALLRHPERDGPSSQQRQHEELVASYLQRYCTKNDTIGFFGPVGWATLPPPADAPPFEVRADDRLIASRGVYFEQWAIDAVAAKLSEDRRFERWMRPRRHAFVRIDRGDEGAVAVSAATGRSALTEDEAAVLGAADGAATAGELAASLGGIDVLEVLRALLEKKLVAWSFEVPLVWRPDVALRRLLDAIDDPALHHDAVAVLDVLEERRAAIEAAAGDVPRLATALADLDATFTAATGASAKRQAGAMYAGRQLVYEDCRRASEVVVGAPVVEAIAPALALVLTSTRWFTFELARAYGPAFREVYEDVARRARGGRVRFADVFLRAQRVLFGAKASKVDAVRSELLARWASVLQLPDGARRVSLRSADLQARVHEVFGAPAPGWRAARHHSPDLMIAARDVAAIRSGEYQVVLGEVHAGRNTLDTAVFYEMHPDPPSLAAAYAEDVPETIIAPVFSKEWPRVTVRMNRAIVTPRTFVLETGFDKADAPRDRVLRLADLFVDEVDGALVTQTPDGPVPLLEMFGSAMTTLSTSAFTLVAGSGHSPRVAIDDLVVSRERWAVLASSIPFADETDDDARMIAARRWATSLGIPRFFFVKATGEVKPMFVDLASPVYVRMFARAARREAAAEGGASMLTITEMLPAPDESWLANAAGERYACELRVIAVDAARGG